MVFVVVAAAVAILAVVVLLLVLAPALVLVLVQVPVLLWRVAEWVERLVLPWHPSQREAFLLRDATT